MKAQGSSIAILDFGSQYTHLIRRCMTELRVRAEVLSPDTPARELIHFSGVILSGGPASVYESTGPEFDPELFALQVPILGICYGHQLMAKELGGKVVPGVRRGYGKALLKIHKHDTLLKNLQSIEQVWLSHGDEVQVPPEGFDVLASTEHCVVAAMADIAKGRYSLQFHPEVEHTIPGLHILRNFVFDACRCSPSLTEENIIDSLINQIRKEVGDLKVFLMVSGGVDSTVAFLLLTKALGRDRVYGIHINTGLLREGETDRIVESLHRFGLVNFEVIEASEDFVGNLAHVTDPEEKRKIIAAAFIRVKDRVMRQKRFNPSQWLFGQGTIYPDLIASGVTTYSHTIKTHHNSLLKERSDFTIIEPLKMFYKDEVRRIGTQLGLPDEFVWKEPFPGPGIAIRILGRITEEKLRLQRQVDRIIEECLKPTPWFRKLWHRFPVLALINEFEEPSLHGHILGKNTEERRAIVEHADKVLHEVLGGSEVEYDSAQCILLPIRSVGIKGDARSYEAPVNVIISHQSTWARVSYDVIEKLGFRLISEIHGINRAVYDITPHAELKEMNTLIFLRLITSRDAMTADWARLEYDLLDSIARRIVSETPVDRVMLDVTQKPPGMMEWE